MIPHDPRRSRSSRLDAVLALRYGYEADGMRVRCDFPFALSGGRLDIPHDVWRGWRRLRLHVAPAADVPPTVLLLADLHGNALTDPLGGPVHGFDHLDVDLLPTRGGTAFSLVLAGPDSVTTIAVSLQRPDGPRVRPGPRGRLTSPHWHPAAQARA